VPIRLAVAADGSGEYHTIQEAVMAVRDFMQVSAVVFIKNGTYREKLLIPSQKTNLTLLGESKEGVVITYGDYSSDADKHSTYTSSTVRVQAIVAIDGTLAFTHPESGEGDDSKSL
jgi:pectinesterase